MAQALAILHQQDIGFAILDINLGGEKSFAVAEALDARGVPYIFTTGYGEAGVPERLRHRDVLQKPYGTAALRNALVPGGIKVDAG